jgi:flagellar hook-length control protein FliK
LGSLRLEVTLEKGAMSARIEAESHMARAVLLDNLPQLRDRLSEQGVQIENFDVDVPDHPTDDPQHHADDSWHPTERLADQPTNDDGAARTEDSKVEDYPATQQGKLNIIV